MPRGACPTLSHGVGMNETTLQIPLFCDSYEDAIRATASAIGGLKATGVALWPTLPADEAGRKLAACLDRDKREKLSLDELRSIRRMAREKGVHILASYEARDAGYADPQPITPEDEAAQLQREYIAAVKAMAALTKRMDSNPLLRSVG